MRRTLAAVVATLAFGACSSAPSYHSEVRAPHPWRFARFAGATDPSAPVQFSVVLRKPHRAAFDAYLRDLYDPSSSSFHRFLTAAQQGRRFGLPAASIRRTEAALEGAGLHVVHSYPQRTALDVRGTVRDVESLFGMTMGDFRDRTGRLFHAPLSAPTVPAALRGTVAAVAGLNGAAVPVEPDSIANGMKRADLARAYDIGPLERAGMDGSGLSIAVISFASFRQQDVQEFDRLTGTQGPTVREVPVGGGSGETTGGGSGEVNLDIDVIRSVAPEAQIYNYSTGGGSTVRSFIEDTADIVDRITQDGRADIATMSWGICDVSTLQDGTPYVDAADRSRAEDAFKSAIAAGISIFHSSGDAGAYQCQRSNVDDQRVTAEWPADLPFVITAGGTNLSVRRDGSYLQETAWEDILENRGTGGGLNPVDARPAWETGPGVDNRFSNGKRQYPDVAAAADPDSGYFTVTPNEKTGASEAGVSGGTSAASPFWAASMLLIEQYAERHGVKKLGFVAPALYDIAQHQNAAAPSFHDITIGGNRFYDCTPGWDYATGLGSPDVDNLARAVVDYLRSHPAA